MSERDIIVYGRKVKSVVLSSFMCYLLYFACCCVNIFAELYVATKYYCRKEIGTMYTLHLSST